MRNVVSSVAIAIAALTLGEVEGLVSPVGGQSPSKPEAITLAVSGRTNVTPWIAAPRQLRRGGLGRFAERCRRYFRRRQP